jgi:hypothetical protein
MALRNVKPTKAIIGQSHWQPIKSTLNRQPNYELTDGNQSTAVTLTPFGWAVGKSGKRTGAAKMHCLGKVKGQESRTSIRPSLHRPRFETEPNCRPQRGQLTMALFGCRGRLPNASPCTIVRCTRPCMGRSLIEGRAALGWCLRGCTPGNQARRAVSRAFRS